jgi:2-oxoglutarate dehydrogenase complex dehydrogenase (E1) component-like enzyme
VETLPFIELSSEEKVNIWKELAESEVFDHFMQKKLPGVKRFFLYSKLFRLICLRYGLEGCEAMIPASSSLFDSATLHGIDVGFQNNLLY